MGSTGTRCPDSRAVLLPSLNDHEYIGNVKSGFIRVSSEIKRYYIFNILNYGNI
jgi:hypothetical protein